MIASPETNARMMRALLWLAAISALVLFGAPRAKAEDKASGTASTSRPPVSAAAVEVSKEAKPASTTSTKSSAEKKSAATTTKNTDVNAVTTTATESKSGAEDSKEGDMTLRAGKDRTDFKSMTIEGEDRVQVEVERPELALELDAEKVPGLESGGAADVMNRVAPDLTSSYLGLSSQLPSPYVGRPWLRQFVSGPVARFQPNVKGVERWKLVVLDSKGEIVRTYEGKGDAPKELTWDGRSQGGTLVTPGLTYSYYFEAFDKAGNKRNFVGEGFKVSAYRVDSAAGPVLVFSGQSVIQAQKNGRAYGMSNGTRGVPAVILEAVSWINQSSNVSQPVQVTVNARSYEQANFLAKQVATTMGELALGDPSRVRTSAEVTPDAADGGVVRVSLAGGADPMTGVAPASAAPSKNEKKESKDSKKEKKGKK
ncbi:MAG TPA: hypothetical protein VFP58_10055 [Candidatus Eisenbacteria bacterium]|nr:hypothetical protein [Candidatus Eisenbacteria bacterium]